MDASGRQIILPCVPPACTRWTFRDEVVRFNDVDLVWDLLLIVLWLRKEGSWRFIFRRNWILVLVSQWNALWMNALRSSSYSARTRHWVERLPMEVLVSDMFCSVYRVRDNGRSWVGDCGRYSSPKEGWIQFSPPSWSIGMKAVIPIIAG